MKPLLQNHKGPILPEPYMEPAKNPLHQALHAPVVPSWRCIEVHRTIRHGAFPVADLEAEHLVLGFGGARAFGIYALLWGDA